MAVTATGGGDPGSLSFTVSSLAAQHQVRSSGSVATADTALTGTTVDVTVDGTTTSFALDGTTTLTDVAAQIDAANLGADAQVLKVADGDFRLVLTADTAGAAHSVSYTTDSQLGAETVTRAGADAQLTLADGLVVTPGQQHDHRPAPRGDHRPEEHDHLVGRRHRLAGHHAGSRRRRGAGDDGQRPAQHAEEAHGLQRRVQDRRRPAG